MAALVTAELQISFFNRSVGQRRDLEIVMYYLTFSVHFQLPIISFFQSPKCVISSKVFTEDMCQLVICFIYVFNAKFSTNIYTHIHTYRYYT